MYDLTLFTTDGESSSYSTTVAQKLPLPDPVDATEKIYISHKLQDIDVQRRYIDLTQLSGMVSTSNGSNVVVGDTGNGPCTKPTVPEASKVHTNTQP